MAIYIDSIPFTSVGLNYGNILLFALERFLKMNRPIPSMDDLIVIDYMYM